MITLRVSILALAMAAASAASAQGYYEGGYAERDYDDQGSVGYDFARVVDVKPVYDGGVLERAGDLRIRPALCAP